MNNALCMDSAYPRRIFRGYAEAPFVTSYAEGERHGGGHYACVAAHRSESRLHRARGICAIDAWSEARCARNSGPMIEIAQARRIRPCRAVDSAFRFLSQARS